MAPSLISHPERIYYCDGCQTFQSLDQPCPHVAPSTSATVLATVLAWGLLLVLGVAAWIGVVRLAPVVWRAIGSLL